MNGLINRAQVRRKLIEHAQDTRFHWRLFHPRVHKWSAHFRWDGPMLVGRTDIGRTTVEVLEINLPHRVAMREALIDEGVFPP